MLRHKTLGLDLTIQTDLLHLHIEEQCLTQGQLRSVQGKSTLYLPQGRDWRNPSHQHLLQHGIAEALRFQAKCYIPARTAALAAQWGYSYKRITIKRIRSRWGSCSSYTNLNFSIYLMLLPAELVDYVISHELSHLRHLNHSKDFWAEVDRMTEGRARILDQQLNRYIQDYLRSL